jgi:hypothetical protein
MMRLFSRAGAVAALTLLLLSPVFAHSPAQPNHTNSNLSDNAAAASSADSKIADAPAAETAAIPLATQGAAFPTDKEKNGTSSPDARRNEKPDPKFLPMLATTGTLGLFTAETADTLPAGGLAFSAFGIKFGRTPGSVTIFQIGVEFSYGITDRLNVYGSFDPYGHTHIGNGSQLSLAPQNSLGVPYQGTIFPTIPQTGTPGYVEDFPFASTNGGGLGNITLGLKYGIVSERHGDPLSLSIRNDVIISSQTNLTKLIANGTQGSPLSDLISFAVSKQWSHVVVTTFNAGYQFSRDPRDSLGADAFQMAGQIKSSAGILLFPESRFQPMTEYSAIVFNGGTRNTTLGARDPIDGVSGFRMYLCKYFAVEAGYRYMQNLKQLNDRHGFVVKLSSDYWPERAKPLPPNHPPTVSLSADKNMVYVDSGDAVAVKATASDPDNDPLTYTWSTSCGHVDGDGPQVRWLSAGTNVGTCHVTVKVDDGRGGFADGGTDINVAPKPNH